MTTKDIENNEETKQSVTAPIVSVPLLFKRTRRLGVVFSQNSIAFCLAYTRFGKPVIADVCNEKFAAEELPAPENYLNAAVGIIHQYVRRNKLQGVPINIGLMSQEIAFRRMYLPAMPIAELREAVRWDGEKLFPFPFSKSAMHFEVVDKVTDGDTKRLGINIVAAKSTMIEDIYKNFASAGLPVGQVNFLPAMMTGIMTSRMGDQTDNRQILIHLDDTRRSMAAFIQNGHLEFFQEFVTPLFINAEDETGLANFDAVAAELQSFQDLYIAQSRISDIGAILISGSLANSPGFVAAVEKQTGIPCRSIHEYEPYRQLTGTLSSDCPSEFLPAIMTATVSPAKQPLAPAEIVARAENKSFLVRVGSVAALSVLTVSTIQYLQSRREHNLSETLQARTAEVQMLEQSPAYQGYLNLAGKLKRSQSYLQLSQSKKDSHFHAILKALAQDVPSDLSFSDIEFKNFDEGLQLRLMGHVRVDNFSPEIILAQYIETLRKLPFLRNVTVTNHHKQKKNDKFDLFFQIQMDTQV